MLNTLNSKRLLPVLLTAALIVGAAIWPSGDGTEAEAAPSARTTYTMVVPAAAFYPGFDGQDYTSGGSLGMTSGMGFFVAPVSFPQALVTVTGITLHAYDNGPYDLTVVMQRVRPAVGREVTMASLGSSGQSTTDPRSFTTAAVHSRTVDARYHSVYLVVMQPGGVNYKFYGVTIRYEA